MTKFNQARRLEDQHVAQKQLQLTRSPEHVSHKPQLSRHSPKSGASVSAAQDQQQAGFDVLGSKVPRQQRTHATYRKGSTTGSLSDGMPGTHTSKDWAQDPGSEVEHSAGFSDVPRRSHSCSAGKQSNAATKPLPNPASRCQSDPAEVMLQAGRVLDQMHHVQAQADHSQQSQDHSSAHPPHESSACSKQRTGNEAGPDLRLDIDMPTIAEQPQQNDVSPPQEPTSSSTTYTHDGLPCSPPPWVASEPAAAADGAHQLASTGKSSAEHVTSPFALPAQQAHEGPADCELGIDEPATLHDAAVLPEPSASQYPQLRTDTSTPHDVADNVHARAANETGQLQNSWQPSAQEMCATDMHVDSATAATASQSPRGTAYPSQLHGFCTVLATNMHHKCVVLQRHTYAFLFAFLHIRASGLAADLI